MVRDHFWKNAFLTHFSPNFAPKMAHFQDILRFSMSQNASPRAHHGLCELFTPLRELFYPSVNCLPPSVNYMSPP